MVEVLRGEEEVGKKLRCSQVHGNRVLAGGRIVAQCHSAAGDKLKAAILDKLGSKPNKPG